jgi:hypothetical protein
MAAQSEADVARGLFERIAAGSTAQAEAQRLSAAGLRSEKRYQGGKRNGGNGASLSIRTTWSADRIRAMVRSTVYCGEHSLGSVVRVVPALVDRVTWERAGRQLTANQSTAKPERGGDFSYALRGVLRCGGCGAAMVGHSVRDQKAARRGEDIYRRYYVCSAAKQAPSERTDASAEQPCRGSHVRCERVETAVLDALRPLVDRPASAIVEAIMRSAGTTDVALAVERSTLVATVAQLERDRTALLGLINSGAADLSEIGPAMRENRARLTAAQDRLTKIDADNGTDDATLEARAMAAVAEAAQASAWFDALDHGTYARQGREYVGIVRGLCSTWLEQATVAVDGTVTVQLKGAQPAYAAECDGTQLGGMDGTQ